MVAVAAALSAMNRVEKLGLALPTYEHLKRKMAKWKKIPCAFKAPCPILLHLILAYLGEVKENKYPGAPQLQHPLLFPPFFFKEEEGGGHQVGMGRNHADSDCDTAIFAF